MYFYRPAWQVAAAAKNANCKIDISSSAQPSYSSTSTLHTSCSSFITLPSKRQREQRNAARAASVEVFKKRRLETNTRINSVQPSIDDDKLNIADESEEEANTGTWFWNESTNKTNSDSEEEDGEDIEEEDLDGE